MPESLLETPTQDRIPTRLSAAVFLGKASLLQLQRAVQNFRQSIRRYPQRCDERFVLPLAESSTPLWTDLNSSEIWYQRGKIQNLRIASSRLHQCIIPTGEIFSFWQQVGRASVHKGYVSGRMLQEGCMIPAIGGGLCQLSNALYQAAHDAGCEIIERHPHSRIVPGSATAAGRDATVAWNYIDLRFRSTKPVQLQVTLTATHLNLSLHTLAQANNATIRQSANKPALPLTLPIFNDHACESCGQVACFRSDNSAAHLKTKPTTAFLLDAAWPEFIGYLATHHSANDILAIPLNGKRWSKPQYAWPIEGFATIHKATVATLARAYRSRRLADQGAPRQKALLNGAESLARQLAKCLNPDVDEVCVSQLLLPFLWHSSVLGGRRVRVLATQLPLTVLQAQLDHAARLHPESKTLSDFRAPQWIVEAEDEALRDAAQIITPHAAIEALFPTKTHLLDWAVPPSTRPQSRNSQTEPPTILFPCATLGRKGAYELREALHSMDVKLILGGKILEDENFWAGFDITSGPPSSFEGIDLVVQPSIVESQPRTLLRALAAGIPVITTSNSGLHPESGAQFVSALDARALHSAICNALFQSVAE